MKKLIAIILMSLFVLYSLNVSSFANDAPFTRGRFCSKVVELLEIDYDVSSFPQIIKDVPLDDENYEAITIMYMLGCMAPDENGSFNPNNYITKAEAIAILVRMIFGEFAVPDNVELSDHWCAKYAWKALDSGIMNNLKRLEDEFCLNDLNVDKLKEYAPYKFNIEESGTCGKNLTWKYTQDGILSIKGTGLMTKFANESEVPWYGKKYFKVIIEDGVETIGKYAFYMSDLIDISIPRSVYSVGDYAFFECKNLEGINIHDEFALIGSYAFSGCSKLTEINIPATVEDLRGSAFRNCSSLKSINVHPDNENYWDVGGVLYSRDGRYKTLECYPIAKVKKEYIIPEGIQYIGEYAFVNCSNLQKITLSSTVDFIGDNAFQNCINLSEINLNEGLQYIYSNAFLSCTNLESIEIPSSVKSIYTTVFRNCNKLNQIIVNDDNSKYCDEDGIIFSKDQKTLVRFPEGKEFNEYTIPDDVQKIGSYAFENCKNLNNVEIGQNVTIIGSDAFLNCFNLKEIFVPSNVIEISDCAFEGCYGLIDVTIYEGVATIGKSAFDDCDSLANIYLPQSVVSIGENAFRNNSFTLEKKFFIYGLAESYAKEYALANNLKFVETTENINVKVSEGNGNIVCNVTVLNDISKEDSKVFISAYQENGQMECCVNSDVDLNDATDISTSLSKDTKLIKIFVWSKDSIKPECGVTYIYL